MFRRTKVCSGVLVALGGALGLGSAPVFGQQQTFERVEITGSSIRRIDAEAALPVTVLKKEDIERTGATSVVDLLQKLPTVQGSTRRVRSVGGGSFGFSGVSIHNIGETRTLVLLNGHRLSPVRRPVAHRLRRRHGPELDPDLGDRARRDPDRRRLGPVWRGRDRRRGQLHHQARHRPKATSRVGLSYPQDDGAEEKRFSISKGFGSLEKDGFNVFALVRPRRAQEAQVDGSRLREHRQASSSANKGKNYRFQQYSAQPDSGQRDRRPRTS